GRSSTEAATSPPWSNPPCSCKTCANTPTPCLNEPRQRVARNCSPRRKQSEAVRELYAGWTQTRLNGEEQDNEHWGDLTRDPGGVDYIETGAGGVLAMWVVPKGVAEDRVLLCMHGGGSSAAPSTMSFPGRTSTANYFTQAARSAP